MSRTREVLVLGGGAAGVMAAVEAARLGAGVLLVTSGPVGGHGTHGGFVPSKVLLHIVAERRVRKSGGALEADDVAHVVAEMQRLRARTEERMAARLDDAGVQVVRGTARFVARDAVEITRERGDTRRERFDAAVVATGSKPAFPAGFFGAAGEPDGEFVLLPRHLASLRTLPRTMLVVGGGATATETAYALQALGVEVTWIVGELGILPGFDRELGESVGDVLMERGIKIVHDKDVVSVQRVGDEVQAKLDGGRTYQAERAFVAIGRRADTANLGLAELGVELDERTGAICVDRELRSSVPSILAAGDAAGAPFLTSKSTIEGWIAGRLAADETAPAAGPYVEAVYTDPEIAIVGLTPQRALAERRAIDVRTIGFDESLVGALHGVGFEPHARGTLRVVVDVTTRTVLGASAVGPRAAEALGPLAVAIRCGTTIDTLATAGMAAPTFGELASAAGRA